MLTLLTATGCRQKAWALCERWMARQTYAGPVRWVIVDDGEEAQPITFKRDGWTLEVIRPKPFWSAGQNTQARNLLAGLEVIDSAERLVVIEDDDWYAADWLAHVDTRLTADMLIGEKRARYYSLSKRVGRELGNQFHSSLCSTAMTGKAIDAFRKVCKEANKFIDMQLWRSHQPRLLFDGHRVVGIKGLPGRGGIGVGHTKEFQGTADSSGRILREWVGDDAAAYL